MIRILLAAACLAASARQESVPVTLVRDGKPALPLAAGSVPDAVDDLRNCLKEISGAEFVIEKGGPEKPGLHVGLFSDFPWASFGKTDDLGAEGFILRTEGGSLFLAAREPPGVRHAVTTFLRRLGCRWFFPGKTWEVLPRRATIEGAWNERQAPAFPLQRRIWYGFGAYPGCREDHEEWCRRNRLGGPIPVTIGHTWHGLDPKKDFEARPEWFALVGGKRQATKPCYSHPDVIRRAIDHALKEASDGKPMVTMSPPDGTGYCECEKCFSVFQGGEPFQAHGTTFAKRPDGGVVNVTSETLFRMVNEVARAVAEQHPRTLVGCYAYSCYSHPPSFKLHPNVFLQTTTAYRRTPLTLEEQLQAFGERAGQVGIREYYSVYQWDWDNPHPGAVEPGRLQKTLRFFRRNGVTSVNAEASNNWAPRGLGYYAAAQLLWDPEADVRALVRDFYEKAFGPAAPVLERYYLRWYGPGAKALDAGEPAGELSDVEDRKPPSIEDLRAAFLDLDEAARLVREAPGARERVDHMRMYLHYLVLRHRLGEAEKGKDPQAILEAIRQETLFAGRLTRTNMVHSRALLGSAFLRRFRRHEKILAGVPEAQSAGKGWRQVGDPPSREELDRLWEEDRALLQRR